MNKNPGLKADDNPAQTASVGDNQMVTYMKLLIPSPMNTGPSGTGSGSGNDSDDARFLDGLFDQTSSASETGSDKGSKEQSTNENIKAQVASRGLTAASDEMVMAPSTTMQNQQNNSSLTSFNLGNQMMQPQHRAPNDISSLTSSSRTQSGPAPTQLPQHLSYQTTSENNFSFLPQNVLGQQQLNIGVGAGAVNSNNNINVHNTMQQYNQWMVNTAPAPHIHQPAAPTVPLHSGVSPTASAPLAVMGQTTPVQSQIQATGQLQQIPQPLQQIPQPTFPQATPGACSAIYADVIQSSPATTCVQTNNSSSSRTNTRKARRNSFVSPSQTETSRKRSQAPSISEDEDEQDKRRKDRNMREQERSQRITKQISDLKSLLAGSNVSFKPDKFSTLVSVHSYIKTLQQRSALLDEEQRKLVDTITKSNEIVNKSRHGHQAGASKGSGDSDVQATVSGRAVVADPNAPVSSEEDEILVFVRGLDYKSVFSKLRIALCVTSIDGRLLVCNDEFIRICGLEPKTLIESGLRSPEGINTANSAEAGKRPLSLFNLMAREDMQKVCEAMSTMLRAVCSPSSVPGDTGAEKASGESKILSNTGRDSNDGDKGMSALQDHSPRLKSDHWGSKIRQCHNSSIKLQLNLSLVRQKDGTPRFFNCALTISNE